MVRPHLTLALIAWLLAAFAAAASVDSSSLLYSKNTDIQLAAARKIVEAALAESSRLNKARLEHPRRNRYTLAPGTKIGKRSAHSDLDITPPPPLLNITADIAKAAALVAEADAREAGPSANTTESRRSLPYTDDGASLHSLGKRDGFWMESISRKGSSPWGDDSSYKIFRNVKDYNAKGDGTTDDTDAINKAISDGKRCGKDCNGSTTKNAVVYLPPGTYLVSTPLIIYYGTQFIGDANNPPLIKAAKRFIGLGALTTDVYVGDGEGSDGKDNEWYVNTASFYRQIRNLRIDVSDTRSSSHTAGIHYQVAQATSLQHVTLIAKSGTTQQGMFSENGSGGVISDVHFQGGKYGFYGGNQQFTTQRLSFDGCDTAVQVIWDWGWVWKTVTVKNSDVGFRLLPAEKTPKDVGNIGSATFMDSTFTDVKTAIVVAPLSEKPGEGVTGIILDNVNFSSAEVAIADSDDKTILNGKKYVGSFVVGPVYNGTSRSWSKGEEFSPARDKTLLGPSQDGLDNPPYFERARPQYEGSSASEFVHLKDLGAKGDGSTDDTSALQKALDDNVGKIIFADAGIYMLHDTVTIPKGTKMVGEAWTQFAATGDKFSDPKKPRPMLRVGNSGDVGSVELQDLLFTSKGPTPGVVLVEWNILADKQGSAAMWDCHARLGGATGTGLTPAECPALKNGQVNAECQTAALMMHITAGGSGYFDNMWLWTADHMIDDPDLVNGKNEMTQLSVFTARGILIESKRATWLYGTSSEHSVFYQYSFNGASHIHAGLIQTESPYYQPSPKAPAPFKDAVGVFPDPDYSCSGGDFDGCDSSWGVIVTESQDIYITSAGVYSFFDTYSQDCIDPHICQKALVLLKTNSDRVQILQLITIGAKYSVVSDGKGILAEDNLSVKVHPSWSQISLIGVTSSGKRPELSLKSPEPCNKSQNYKTLEDLVKDKNNVPQHCRAAYAMPAIYDMLHGAMTDYKNLTEKGSYDKKYDAYVRFIKKEIPYQLDEFMDPTKPGPGNKYFSCVVTRDIPRSFLAQNGTQINVTESDIPQIDIGPRAAPKTSDPCKPDVAYTDPTHDPFYTIEYTLKDHDGFYKELLDKYGIIEDWVKFGEKVDQRHCGSRGCPTVNRKFKNYPKEADDVKVQDPKEIISKGFDTYNKLQDTILGYSFELLMGTYTGYTKNTMETLIMPTSMAMQAVEAMKKVVKIGDEEIHKERTELITTIIGAILMVLPIVGEGAGAIGGIVATIGRLIDLVAAGTDAAMASYSIYEDKNNAPFAIFSILTDGLGSFGRVPKEMDDMGKYRRGMSKDDLGKLGDTFKKNDDDVQELSKVCKLK